MLDLKSACLFRRWGGFTALLKRGGSFLSLSTYVYEMRVCKSWTNLSVARSIISLRNLHHGLGVEEEFLERLLYVKWRQFLSDAL